MHSHYKKNMGNVTLHTENSNCCFSKLFGYFCCMTILPMLMDKWTSGYKSGYKKPCGRLVRFTQVQCKFNQS